MIDKKTVEQVSFRMTWENAQEPYEQVSLVVKAMKHNVQRYDWDKNPALVLYLVNRLPDTYRDALRMLGYDAMYPTSVRYISSKHQPILTPEHFRGQPFYVNCYVRYLDSDEQQYVTIGVNYKVHDEDDDETFGNIREDDVYEGYDTGDWVIVSVIGFSPLTINGDPTFRYTVEVE